MLVSVVEGHRVWSESYDHDPNPLLALEERVLAERIGPLRGRSFLDAAAGTGRWMERVESRGGIAFGVDLCPEMLAQAARKAPLGGRLALGDITALPFPDGAFDTALCSFALGYLSSTDPLFRELARVAHNVIVSDLHPCGVRAGWTRSFRARGRHYEIQHYFHSEEEIQHAARNAGLVSQWRTDAHFEEPEREFFRRAGREGTFAAASRIPAVLITAWSKP